MIFIHIYKCWLEETQLPSLVLSCCAFVFLTMMWTITWDQKDVSFVIHHIIRLSGSSFDVCTLVLFDLLFMKTNNPAVDVYLWNDNLSDLFKRLREFGGWGRLLSDW